MLQITQRRQEGTLIAVYTGELDHHAARAAIEQTEDLLVLFPCEKLVLDLSELTFMDSSGIGIIIGRYKKISYFGGKVFVINTDTRIKKSLMICGLHKIIEIME